MVDRAGLKDLFTAPAGGQTAKVFIVFGFLLILLLATIGEVAFRDLSLRVVADRIDLGRSEAEAIAREIAQLGRDGPVMDYSRLRRNKEQLQQLIQDRIADRMFIRYVEVRDRFGMPIVFVPGEAAGAAVLAPQPGVPRWPAAGEEVIQVPIGGQGAGPTGEVRVSISQQALEQEFRDLRRSLRIKLTVAGVVALCVLVLGLFYVLHLIRKNRVLEEARQSADRASYVGLLASGLAHEIRNPLNAMNMNLQMLEEELLAPPYRAEPDHRELLESTKSEIQRLERLVNNFLSYARPAQPRLVPTDLNHVVAEVLRFLEADFRQHGIELASDLEPLLPTVDLDETQFKQALMNLLVNARQILPRGGAVTVRTRAGPSGELVLEVADDGPGVPVEARERIFEVFYSNRGGGTGLGLPIARQIVERHGGKIELESSEGQGTTFRIRLPRHPRAPAVAAAQAAR
jgi:signal transduction histidine kinase